MKTSLQKFLLGTLVTALGLMACASPARAWWNSDWTVRKKITLDASSAGANITDPTGTPVVLVRLHDGDFSFGTAKDDGSDIRFIAEDDKTPLTYHVEKYDSLLGEAFVWVKVPSLKPGAATTIWLYYGDTGTKSAPGGADAKATYDADTVPGLPLRGAWRARARFHRVRQRLAKPRHHDRRLVDRPGAPA